MCLLFILFVYSRGTGIINRKLCHMSKSKLFIIILTNNLCLSIGNEGTLWIKVTVKLGQETNVYPHTYTNISGYIIKHDLRTNTLPYKKISLTFYSRKGWYFCGVWEMGGDIYTEMTSSSHIFFQVPGGANACAPLQAETRLVDCVSHARLRFSALSKFNRVVLIPWSPSSYIPVRPECPDRAVLFTNHNVTACQSTRGH